MIPFLTYKEYFMNYVIGSLWLALLCAAFCVDSKSPQTPSKKVPSKSVKKLEEVTAPVSNRPKRVLVDAVLATIYHPEGIVPVRRSDLRPGLSGQAPSLQDAILKELIILDGKALSKAKMLHMGATEEEVEKALSRAQEQLQMTREELIAFFKDQGLTLDEAKRELERGLMVESVIDARVKTKAHVSNKAIEQYHRDHPLITYSLCQATVPLGLSSKALTRALIKREIESGEIETSVKWLDIGAVPEKDFAPEKAFIKELAPGSVVISDEADDGFTLLKIVSKKVATLEERKNDIAQTLAQERYGQTQKAYFEKLLQEAHVRYSSASKAA